MNHSTASSPLHSRPPPEESQHRMSAPAQVTPHPICHGMITARKNSENQSSTVGDDDYLHDVNLPFLPFATPRNIAQAIAMIVVKKSTFSLNTDAELIVNAARALKPGMAST